MIAYTIGHEANYDLVLADSAASGRPMRKTGKGDQGNDADYPGGWVFETSARAAAACVDAPRLLGSAAVFAVYFAPGTSAEEREAAMIALADRKARRFGSVAFVVVPSDVGVPYGVDTMVIESVHEVMYSSAIATCPKCDCTWSVWTRAQNRREAMMAVGAVGARCPACHPEHYVAELDATGRIELVRALVHTDAVETMAVLLDQAIGEGRTREAQWHNPDDLAEIERLTKERDALQAGAKSMLDKMRPEDALDLIDRVHRSLARAGS